MHKIIQWHALCFILLQRGDAMELSLLEVFVVFWTSAILWVLVEFIYYRHSKNRKNNNSFDTFVED